MLNKYNLYSNKKLANLIGGFNFNLNEVNNFPSRALKDPIILNAILEKISISDGKFLSNEKLVINLLKINPYVINYVPDNIIDYEMLKIIIDSNVFLLNDINQKNMTEDLALMAIEKDYDINNLDETFKNSPLIALESVKKNKNNIKKLKPNLITKQIIDIAFKGYLSFDNDDRLLFENNEFAKKALSIDGNYLQFVKEENIIPELIDIATTNKGIHKNILSKELFKKYLNTKLIVETVLKNQPSYIDCLNREYQLLYKDIIFEILKKEGNSLEYCIPEFKNDFDMVNTAIKSGNNAFKFASPEMRNIRKNVYEALEKSSLNYLYISPRLKDSTEILLSATKQDASALSSASDRLKNDPNIIISIVKNNPMTINTMPANYKFEILNSIFNNTEPYNILKEHINLKELIISYVNDITYNLEFLNSNIDKIIKCFDIPNNEFSKDCINRLGVEVLFTDNNLLFDINIANKIGKENVFMILKYLIIPKETLNINEIIKFSQLDKLLEVVYELNGKEFDLKQFQAITNGFYKNNELVNNIDIKKMSDKDKVLLKKLFKDNESNSKFINIDDLRNYPKIKYDKNMLLIEKDMEECYKNVIFDILCNSNTNEITRILYSYIDNNKLTDLEKALGKDYTEKIEYYKYFSDILSKINNCDDKEILKDIALKLNQKLYENNKNSETSFIDKVNSDFLNFESELKELYGKELQSSLLNLNKPQDKLLKDKIPNTNIDLYTLNGCDFKILVHVLNAYGTGGKLTDFDERENGRSYLCTSLISNYFMGHANRGENSVYTVKLGFLDIDFDMLSISAPTDVYSQGEKNSREITSHTKPNFMTTSKTCLNTLHTHNEYVMYRESNSHKRIYPNCILCFSEEVNQSHIEAANTFNPPLPIVKINVDVYQKQHLGKIKELEEQVLNNNGNIEEYLLMMSSYRLGYRCLAPNINSEEYNSEVILNKVNDLVTKFSKNIDENYKNLENLLNTLIKMKSGIGNNEYYSLFDSKIDSIRNMLITGKCVKKDEIKDNDSTKTKIEELEQIKNQLINSNKSLDEKNNHITDIIKQDEYLNSNFSKYSDFNWVCDFMKKRSNTTDEMITKNSDYVCLMTYVLAKKYNFNEDQTKELVVASRYYDIIDEDNKNLSGLKSAQNYKEKYKYYDDIKNYDIVESIIKSHSFNKDEDIKKIVSHSLNYDEDKIKEVIKLSHIFEEAIKICNNKTEGSFDQDNKEIVALYKKIIQLNSREEKINEEEKSKNK